MTNDIRRDESAGIVSMLLAALKGMLVGAAAIIILSLISSAVALLFADPNAAVGVLAYVALGIGAISSGFGAVMSDEERSLFSAVLSGAMIVLVMWFVSLFMRGEGGGVPWVWTALVYAACVLLSLLGGFIGRGRRVRVGEGKNSPTALMRKRLGTGKR